MFAVLPADWDHELQNLDSALRRPERHWPTHTLELTSALREIANWTQAGRESGEHRAGQDWQSLAAEIAECIKYPSYGGKLRPLIEADLLELKRKLDHERSIESSKRAGELARKLLSTLSETTALLAGWDDLVQAARTTSRDVTRLRRRRNELLRIAELQGFPLGTFGVPHQVLGILADQSNQIYAATGTSAPLEESDLPMARLYGMEKADRIRLARDQWVKPKRTESNIVWLTYDHAPIETEIIEFGQVRFYSGWHLASLFRDTKKAALIPEELEPKRWPTEFIPEDEYSITYVRVDLGTTPAFRVISQAVELATAVLDAFRPSSERLGWIRRSTVQHFSAHSRSTADFGGQSARSWRPDPTGQLLREYAHEVETPVAFTDSFRRVLIALSRLRAGASESSTQVIAASVELIEIVKTLARDGSTEWWTFVQESFKEPFVLDTLVSRFVNSALALDDGEAIRWVDDDKVNRVREITDSFTSPDGDQLIQIHLASIREGCLELLDAIYPDTLLHADLADGCGFLTPSGAVGATRRTRTEFDLLLGRLKRCRNAIAHGWPIDEQTATVTATFAEKIATMSFRCFLAGHTSQSRDALSVIEAERLTAANRLAQIERDGYLIQEDS